MFNLILTAALHVHCTCNVLQHTSLSYIYRSVPISVDLVPQDRVPQLHTGDAASSSGSLISSLDSIVRWTGSLSYIHRHNSAFLFRSLTWPYSSTTVMFLCMCIRLHILTTQAAHKDVSFCVRDTFHWWVFTVSAVWKLCVIIANQQSSFHWQRSLN